MTMLVRAGEIQNIRREVHVVLVQRTAVLCSLRRVVIGSAKVSGATC
jgi:hypothetical protein